MSPQKRQQQQQERPQLSPRQEDGRESGQQAAAAGLGIGTGERERERKFSKRDLFGGLLSRSKGRGTSSSASTPASSTKSGWGAGAESPIKLPSARFPHFEASMVSDHPRFVVLFSTFFVVLTPVVFSGKVSEVGASSLDQLSLHRPEAPMSLMPPRSKAGDEEVLRIAARSCREDARNAVRFIISKHPAHTHLTYLDNHTHLHLTTTTTPPLPLRCQPPQPSDQVPFPRQCRWVCLG
ncbi:hypothetical protein CORC01_08205 [Colletotrichum orchidophilum]|uniref:Uncharacterized protein n=1 Tax=Colletotrichum orchidophilum TaxID=1209926 RepID=A0A1G4B589_9PEZI|nr:uncharacterized protein CORC01_08205 [Colletotrichum orchidophilum]OHE96442.1 hypothetical protein CORC01_08205 [Colletotrichum orchidophilum]